MTKLPTLLLPDASALMLKVLSHSSFIGLLLAVGQLAIMARDNAITKSRSRERLGLS